MAIPELEQQEFAAGPPVLIANQLDLIRNHNAHTIKNARSQSKHCCELFVRQEGDIKLISEQEIIIVGIVARRLDYADSQRAVCFPEGSSMFGHECAQWRQNNRLPTPTALLQNGKLAYQGLPGRRGGAH